MCEGMMAKKAAGVIVTPDRPRLEPARREGLLVTRATIQQLRAPSALFVRRESSPTLPPPRAEHQAPPSPAPAVRPAPERRSEPRPTLTEEQVPIFQLAITLRAEEDQVLNTEGKEAKKTRQAAGLLEMHRKLGLPLDNLSTLQMPEMRSNWGNMIVGTLRQRFPQGCPRAEFPKYLQW